MNHLAVFHLPVIHITLELERRFLQVKFVWIHPGINRLPVRITQQLFPFLARCLFLARSVARRANSTANHGVLVHPGKRTWVRLRNRRRRGSRLGRRLGKCRRAKAAIARRRGRSSGLAHRRIRAQPVSPPVQHERSPSHHKQDDHEGKSPFHSHFALPFRRLSHSQILPDSSGQR